MVVGWLALYFEEVSTNISQPVPDRSCKNDLLVTYYVGNTIPAFRIDA